VRNRQDIRLVYENKQIQKLINSRLYKDYSEINDDLVLIKSFKKTCKLDKPIQIGMFILDFSKLHMYKFWYDHLKATYGENVKLIYTDTDSLVFQVFTNDFYEDMLKNKNLYDLSEYDKNSKMFDVTNKKVLGKFKDECSKSPIVEFIAIRSKMYCYRCDDNKLIKKIKGIKKSCVDKEITFDDYKNCVFENTTKNVQMNVIRSDKHRITSQSINKLALSSICDKRFLLDENNSLAHGHFKIKEMSL